MRLAAIEPQNEVFRKAIWLSFSAHMLLFIFMTVRAFFSPELEYQNAIRVDLVGLPDKVQNLPDKSAEQPASSQQKIAAESEEAPAEKLKPNLPDKTKDPDAINLDRSKDKQKKALNKLKQMNAFEKIQAELERESKGKSKPASKAIKGNQISNGSQITGLAKIQANEYIGEVEKQIRRNWALPQWLRKKEYQAQVRLRFGDNGEILSVQIAKSSGNSSFDDICVETVQKSAPFPAPPEALAKVFSLEGILVGFPD